MHSDAKPPTPSSPAAIPHTKVIATIGPASEGRIGEMIEAGMSVARINLSHGTEEDFLRRVALIRREADARMRAVGILLPRDFVFVVVASITIAFLATLYPSRQAARLDPVQALRFE